MITRDDIKKLAALSRINMSEEEQEGLRGEIDSILAYVDQVKKVSATLSGEPALPEHRNVMRADGEPHESGLHTETLLNAAPKREGGYLKVKKILGEPQS